MYSYCIKAVSVLKDSTDYDARVLLGLAVLNCFHRRSSNSHSVVVNRRAWLMILNMVAYEQIMQKPRPDSALLPCDKM